MNLLTTRFALHMRRVVPDAICPRCGQHAETIVHALVSCPTLEGSWVDVGLSLGHILPLWNGGV